MKKRIAIISTIIALAALAAVPFAYAGPGGHGRHGGEHGGLGMFGRLDRMQEKLDLSDQQVDQIKAIFTDLRAQNEQYRDQVRGGFHGVAELLLQNPNDVAGAQALLDQQAAAEKVMKSNLLNATSKALNVLNADQRAKLSEMLSERAERRERRR